MDIATPVTCRFLKSRRKYFSTARALALAVEGEFAFEGVRSL
jgi:hypothetical protein